jgi:hypothetical protein
MSPGIGQAKGHDQELEQALMGLERRLLDVVRVHPDLMVAGTEIKLGEELSPA